MRGSINFLNLTKENKVAADAWLAITSVEGSPHLDLCCPHAMDDYERLSSSILETSRGGGFVMDFSTFPRFNGRDPWPTTRASDGVSGNQPTATGKFLPHPWQSESENPPSNLFLQGSASGTNYFGSTLPSGECFAGVSNSGCALSLLSNQPWSSRDRPSSLGLNNFLNADGATMVHQSAATHGATVNHFSSTSYGVSRATKLVAVHTRCLLIWVYVRFHSLPTISSPASLSWLSRVEGNTWNGT